jgi:DNA polymerase-3 subunit gamma/tau
MSYQVIARKYRPQRFDDVVGQRGVTQTLRNAIARGRLAHAFVFAGPRGVGKTTTARILARALNCVTGPTIEPCGACDACLEIAEGRDIDVLEIDAATHTQVDNVREVIISGLGIRPVRDRYKVFIIDEVHQLSPHSFNALLKSIEEPPPHVVFVMATTELSKIPETIQSRSQVFEFKTIGAKTIADQLRAVAQAEKIAIEESALVVLARSADGSMRDAQSAFDQVIAFAGDTITADDVAAVLGLIGRDLLFDVVEAVAAEDAPAAFALTGRFVEAGHDLRLVCRELARLVRDLLVVSIDPTRAADLEIAADAERERLVTLARRYSREDLMRAFDVLARAELDVRGSSQPRYHLEMALLRWMHLRKLVPLADLLDGMKGGTLPAAPVAAASRRVAGPTEPPAPVAVSRPVAPASAPPPTAKTPPGESPAGDAAPEGDTKSVILAEIKRTKKFFHGTVVAQAQRIDLVGNRLVFAYTAGQRTLASQLEQSRAWLEGVASRIAGRTVAVGIETVGASAAASPASDAPESPADTLRAKAMEDTVVQAMLDVFPAQISDVEEI